MVVSDGRSTRVMLSEGGRFEAKKLAGANEKREGRCNFNEHRCPQLAKLRMGSAGCGKKAQYGQLNEEKIWFKPGKFQCLEVKPWK